MAMTFQRRGRGGEGLSSSSVVENRFSSSSSGSGTSWQQQNYSPTACLVATLQTRAACRITPPSYLPSICCLPACLLCKQGKSAACLSGKVAAIGCELAVAAVPRWDEEGKGGCSGSSCTTGHHCSKTSLHQSDTSCCPDLSEETGISGYPVVGSANCE